MGLISMQQDIKHINYNIASNHLQNNGLVGRLHTKQ